MPTVLVLGGTGFLGRNFVEYFASLKEWDITATHFTRTPWNYDIAEWIKVDLRKEEEVARAISNFDVVIQAAATTSGMVHKVNVESAPSQLLVPKGSDSPVNPTCSIIGYSTPAADRAVRSAASFGSARRRACCEGSTANTRVTSAGYTEALAPEPNPISTMTPSKPEIAFSRHGSISALAHITSTIRGKTRSSYRLPKRQFISAG